MATRNIETWRRADVQVRGGLTARKPWMMWRMMRRCTKVITIMQVEVMVRD